jgi:hypothetical protein
MNEYFVIISSTILTVFSSMAGSFVTMFFCSYFLIETAQTRSTKTYLKWRKNPFCGGGECGGAGELSCLFLEKDRLVKRAVAAVSHAAKTGPFHALGIRYSAFCCRGGYVCHRRSRVTFALGIDNLGKFSGSPREFGSQTPSSTLQTGMTTSLWKQDVAGLYGFENGA